jgi:hypothetical protein
VFASCCSSNSALTARSCSHGNISAAGYPAANEIKSGTLAASAPVLRIADSW